MYARCPIIIQCCDFRPYLRSKIKFKTANEIQGDLVDNQKFNFAYIYHKTKAEYIIMLANSKVEAGSRRRVRMMKEIIRKCLRWVVWALAGSTFENFCDKVEEGP